MDVNDTNAKLQIKNELKVVNIAQIKPFVEEAPKCLSQDESRSSQSNQRLNQDNPWSFSRPTGSASLQTYDQSIWKTNGS